MAAFKKSSIALVNPTDELISSINALGEKIRRIYLSIFSSSRHERISQENGTNNFMSKRNFNFKFNKNIFKLVLPILVVLAVGSILVTVFSQPSNDKVLGATTTKDDVKTTQLNKTFTFPLKDGNNKDAGKFSYIIESAELRHQIVVKGSNATSVPGRVFFIINIKLVNDLDKGLSINTRDYVRISVDGGKEWFAPDIHNDPVEAQAISTKNTRLGIAIDDKAKEEIKLQVGEIGGKKTVIPVSFK